jgi:hypothetical protein
LDDECDETDVVNFRKLTPLLQVDDAEKEVKICGGKNLNKSVTYRNWQNKQ